MTGSEAKTSKAEEKARIREKYKGLDPSKLDVIPAIKPADFYNDKSTKRVAEYARVSTDDPNQTSSYELQKNHYTDVVSRHEGWELSEIYADEGISGTSLQHRDAFVRMIQDCKRGKIDMIITKSVSRFARNVVHCISYVRELAELKPPIGVFFETENIYTLNPNSEMSLSFISTLAQEESHNKSEIMNSSIEMRFRRGIFLTPPLLGYDQDENGNLIVNEDEAKTVRLIFFMYLYGYTCVQIAETLTKLGRKTKSGKTKWHPGSIIQQLENERHCGDVRARKTFTPNYINHKSRKNRHDRNQYYQKDHHEPIISRDDFIAVQRLISNAKYGGDKILPQLRVINEGILKGFVIINPKWSGFTPENYFEASDSVYEDGYVFPETYQIEVDEGEFDLSGFEVTRTEYIDTLTKTRLALTTENIKFSTGCLKKLPNVMYVEMLVHPTLKLLAVRPTTKTSKNAIKWCVFKETEHQPTVVGAKAYMNTLFDLFDWDTSCKYCVRGERVANGTDTLLIFKLSDTEMFYREKPENGADNANAINDADSRHKNRPQTVHAFPMHWVSHFGDEYYRRAQIEEILEFTKNKVWKASSEGVPFETEPLDVTSSSVLKTEIDGLIDTFEKEDDTDE